MTVIAFLSFTCLKYPLFWLNLYMADHIQIQCAHKSWKLGHTVFAISLYSVVLPHWQHLWLNINSIWVNSARSGQTGAAAESCLLTTRFAEYARNLMDGLQTLDKGLVIFWFFFFFFLGRDLPVFCRCLVHGKKNGCIFLEELSWKEHLKFEASKDNWIFKKRNEWMYEQSQNTALKIYMLS